MKPKGFDRFDLADWLAGPPRPHDFVGSGPGHAADAGFAEWGGNRLYRYVARVKEPFDRHVHDGDTFEVVLDLGLKTVIDGFVVRPYGYDSPELDTPEGVAARDFLIGQFVSQRMRTGAAMLAVETLVDRNGEERMTFSRYLCHVALVRPEGRLVDLASLMIESGHGVERTR